MQKKKLTAKSHSQFLQKNTSNIDVRQGPKYTYG